MGIEVRMTEQPSEDNREIARREVAASWSEGEELVSDGILGRIPPGSNWSAPA